jgi:Ni,Fe-hydrogenase I large subunit
MPKIKVAPMNRIEGHMDIEAETGAGTMSNEITNAKVKALMFRGIEEIMKKRDPRDAPIITQRPCGVCPTDHGEASCKAIGDAFGIRVDHDFVNGPDPIACPDNGRILRNLVLGSNFVMSHILHFYHLVALDYVNVNSTNVIPKGFFCPNYDNDYYARGIDPTGTLGVPAYTVNAIGGAAGVIPAGALGDLTHYFAGQYVRALKFRRMTHQLHALFGGKMPHMSNYTPGCMTCKPYDPNPAGADQAVVVRVHEWIYAGPGVQASNITNYVSGATNRTHPLNGTPITLGNPHPESILGFIGKPTDFWTWATDNTGSTSGIHPALGYAPEYLPLWAQAGVPGTLPNAWKPYTGTFMFDTVAAAHVFPEYFWIGTGVSRHLAWGAFEDAVGDAPWIGTPHDDGRLLIRATTHIHPTTGAIQGWYEADHLKAREYVDSCWYDDTPGLGRHMWAGKTKWNPDKAGAYTFAKTPRYTNSHAGTGHPAGVLPYEVGPLSRLVANAKWVVADGGLANPAVLGAVVSGDRMGYYPGILRDVDAALVPANPFLGGSGIGVFPAAGAAPGNLGTAFAGVLWGSHLDITGYKSNYIGDGVLDRIAARTLEAYYIAKHMFYWFNSLDPNQPQNVTRHFDWGEGKGWKELVPKKSKGAGLSEAARGALGHWIKIGKPKGALNSKTYQGKVSKYQIITPTAWNVSPIDVFGNHGPIEESLIGTPIARDDEPIEVLRVVHSFDPCLSCTVHVMDVKGNEVFKATLDPA